MAAVESDQKREELLSTSYLFDEDKLEILKSKEVEEPANDPNPQQGMCSVFTRSGPSG